MLMFTPFVQSCILSCTDEKSCTRRRAYHFVLIKEAGFEKPAKISERNDIRASTLHWVRHFQPPDYRTYSTEVTSVYRAISRFIATLFLSEKAALLTQSLFMLPYAVCFVNTFCLLFSGQYGIIHEIQPSHFVRLHKRTRNTHGGALRQTQIWPQTISASRPAPAPNS